jgi:hypothetical protein
MRTKSVKRTPHLIADFENGFAKGWYMAVKESFKNELDIKYLSRKDSFEWTQGPYYCFSQGQTFYDTKLAYSDWESAISNTTKACQILEAKPNLPIKLYNESINKYVIDVKEGYVRFVILKINEARSKLTEFACYEMSQNEFVTFLKTGEL